MSKRGYLLLTVVSALLLQVHAHPSVALGAFPRDGTVSPTSAVPTIAVPVGSVVAVPTLHVPQPTATPRPKPKHRRQAQVHKRTVAQVTGTWVLAYLTSYCPGSAGWLSSSGRPVFYGMLANNFYAFGTRVYLPVLGLTGVVEDRLGAFNTWYHFDVWSPTCYGTPTGWFRVQVLTR